MTDEDKQPVWPKTRKELVDVRGMVKELMTEEEQAIEAESFDAVREIVKMRIAGFTQTTASETTASIFAALHALGWRKVGEGEVVVPVKPTKEMALAGEIAVGNAIDMMQDSFFSYVIQEPDIWAAEAWKAMIAAAKE